MAHVERSIGPGGAMARHRGPATTGERAQRRDPDGVDRRPAVGQRDDAEAGSGTYAAKLVKPLLMPLCQANEPTPGSLLVNHARPIRVFASTRARGVRTVRSAGRHPRGTQPQVRAQVREEVVRRAVQRSRRPRAPGGASRGSGRPSCRARRRHAPPGRRRARSRRRAAPAGGSRPRARSARTPAPGGGPARSPAAPRRSWSSGTAAPAR